MNWKRFARLQYDLTVDTVILALGLEIPAEGRPATFSAGRHPEHGSFSVTATDIPGVWLLFDGSGSCLRQTDAVLAAARQKLLTKGTPTGDALRRWIALWEPVPTPGLGITSQGGKGQ